MCKSIVIYNSLHPSPTTLYTHTYCLFNIAWGHTNTHTDVGGRGDMCVLACVSPLRMVKGALLRPANPFSVRDPAAVPPSPFPPTPSFLLFLPPSLTNLCFALYFLRLHSSLSPFYLPQRCFWTSPLGSLHSLFSMWINKNSSPHLNSFRVSCAHTLTHTHAHIHTRLCHVYKSLESKVTRGHTSLPGHCAPLWLVAATAGNSARLLA